jgi:phosphoketolase
LLGHFSGAIPGVPGPAGPLGQGQHFALAAALLHRTTLFPVTLGDGGMGEPYVMSALLHFITAFPEVTNFLPILIWNGFSQEHHSMVSTRSNAEMTAYWCAHGFRRVIVVDAKEFDDAAQPGAFVDSTRFSVPNRVRFTAALLDGLRGAAGDALAGIPSVLIVKQIKGAGAHASGAKSHHLYPHFTLEHEAIVEGLKRRALAPEAWQCVRRNFSRAGGGPASRVILTEQPRPLVPVPPLPYARLVPGGNPAVPSTAIGPLVAAIAAADPDFLASNADGNEASGLRNVSDALVIRHPVSDAIYSQGPAGRMYEPISEDACAGLAGALALLGGRSIWFSYESFAINGLPFFQTVTQAMAELRRRTPCAVAMLTAGALEQARNGWTHQRPEIEAYLAAMMRNGNVFPLFPVDANGVQAAYSWALKENNKGVVIICSKTPLSVRLTLEESEQAVRTGVHLLYESPATERSAPPVVVFATVGDLIQASVLEAARLLEAKSVRVRIVAVVNPRRLYRPEDVAVTTTPAGAPSEPDFMGDADFDAHFSGDVLFAVSGGAGAMLEPVMLRARQPRRRLMCWHRGDTAAAAGTLLEINRLDPVSLVSRALQLLSVGG